MKLVPLALVVFAGAVVLAGCGGSSSSPNSSPASPTAPEVSPNGDIPDNQAFVEYAPPGGDYAVKVPEGWAQSTDGGAVTFTDKLNSIRMEAVAAAKAPTVATAKATDVPALASSTNGFQLTDVTTVSRKAGNAVLITYLATGAPDAVTGKSVTDAVERYAFFKNGRTIILTLSGPKGADNVDPWRIVSDSLRWTA